MHQLLFKMRIIVFFLFSLLPLLVTSTEEPAPAAHHNDVVDIGGNILKALGDSWHGMTQSLVSEWESIKVRRDGENGEDIPMQDLERRESLSARSIDSKFTVGDDEEEPAPEAEQPIVAAAGGYQPLHAKDLDDLGDALEEDIEADQIEL
jgi:hypothetical protein